MQGRQVNEIKSKIKYSKLSMQCCNKSNEDVNLMSGHKHQYILKYRKPNKKKNTLNYPPKIKYDIKEKEKYTTLKI